jgi:hypothetical protein
LPTVGNRVPLVTLEKIMQTMAIDLGLLFTGMSTLAAIVWAGVAYLVFGWADRLAISRTPGINVAILIGGGFVAPVLVLTTLLALALPYTPVETPSLLWESVSLKE